MTLYLAKDRNTQSAVKLVTVLTVLTIQNLMHFTCLHKVRSHRSVFHGYPMIYEIQNESQ